MTTSSSFYDDPEKPIAALEKRSDEWANKHIGYYTTKDWHGVVPDRQSVAEALREGWMRLRRAVATTQPPEGVSVTIMGVELRCEWDNQTGMCRVDMKWRGGSESNIDRGVGVQDGTYADRYVDRPPSTEVPHTARKRGEE
jgi:hypothetical protein